MATRRANGFMLLELLVALTVFGLLLVGLSEGMRYGLRAWGMQARIAARGEDLDAIDRMLRRLITQADPGEIDQPPLLSGGPRRLDLVSTLPDAGHGSVQRVQASLLLQGDRLMLRWRPWRHAQPLGPPLPTTDTELLAHVAHLDISYWPREGGWKSDWRSAALPALVRIRVMFPAGDLRHWPEIVAAPMLDRP